MQGLQSFAVIALVVVATGCNNQPNGSILIRGMGVNGYEFDYEMTSPRLCLANLKWATCVIWVVEK